MPSSPPEPTQKHPPRPPRDTAGTVLLHSPEGATGAPTANDELAPPDPGPAWVKAPPPRYHLEEGGRLAGLAPTPSGVSPQAAHPAATVRCARCGKEFTWTMAPLAQVACPYCGAKGALK